MLKTDLFKHTKNYNFPEGFKRLIIVMDVDNEDCGGYPIPVFCNCLEMVIDSLQCLKYTGYTHILDSQGKVIGYYMYERDAVPRESKLKETIKWLMGWLTKIRI